jgi:hypothetical protein
MTLWQFLDRHSGAALLVVVWVLLIVDVHLGNWWRSRK